VLGKSEWKYNAAGMLTEYKTDGKNDYQHAIFSCSKLQYDAKGNMTELNYFDQTRRSSTASGIIAYDALNRVSELVIYDAENDIYRKRNLCL
jgi:hypothetical protein